MRLQSKFLVLLLLVGWTGFSNAYPIYWGFSGKFSDKTGGLDPLGIDGETFNVLLTFDSQSIWKNNLFLTMLPVSSTVYITGGNSMALSTSPVVKHRPGVFVGLFDSPSDVSYWDFTFNGTVTITHNDNVNSSSQLVPIVGQYLLPGHLPNDPRGILEGISLPFDHRRLYNTEEAKITIEVPTPATALLTLTALIGLRSTRR